MNKIEQSKVITGFAMRMNGMAQQMKVTRKHTPQYYILKLRLAFFLKAIFEFGFYNDIDLTKEQLDNIASSLHQNTLNFNIYEARSHIRNIVSMIKTSRSINYDVNEIPADF